MADNIKKKTFRIAKPEPEHSPADVEEMKKKIHAHRMRIATVIGIVLLILAIAAVAVYFYFEYKTYSGYQVISQTAREDSSSAQFMEFNGNILRYSNDGAFYTDTSNNLIWNQTYEMQEPIVDTCGKYVVFAEKDGTKIYILDTTESKGTVTTTYPIKQVEIASQGTIAVLMEADGVSYLQLYDKTGNNLAEGELHMENSGSAMDIALSNDGLKMGISMLDVNKGSVQTTIAFYNFDSVGQNEIDNIVASYSYEDTVIPQLEFVTNDVMLAFGDSQVLVFEGTQKPEVTATLDLDEEVKSIFYSDSNFGLVYSAADEDDPDKNQMYIYDMNCKQVMEQSFSLDYSEISFLSNGEICVQNNQKCILYTMRGIRKFAYRFDYSFYKILPGTGWSDYILILGEKTEKVRLK